MSGAREGLAIRVTWLGPSVFPEPWHLTPGTWHLSFSMVYADPLDRAAPFLLGQLGLALLTNIP
jgi:hypothetical protein